MNPIMQLLNNSQPLNSQPSEQNSIFNIINAIRTAQNPQSMLNNMLTTNPQLQAVMNYVNSQGGDAKQAFYNLAQQRGVDPQTILDQLK